MLSNGIITKVNSDTFTVKVDNSYLDCKVRGKFRNIKLKPVVGDKVLVDKTNKTIEKVLDRDNYLLRPPVANIDIAIIVTSLVEPNINITLLDKLISIITINKIEPVILFTKLDLGKKSDIKNLKDITKYYQKIGIKVFNNKNLRKIKKYLKGKIVTVCGQTGAGKSTFLNKLDKRLNLQTNEISKSLGRGKHTTRIVELFEIDNFYIVDTPGFSSIDINIYTIEEIKKSFIEFNNITCKFNNCNHLNEKGCKVVELVHNNLIRKSRYDSYIRFIKETK